MTAPENAGFRWAERWKRDKQGFAPFSAAIRAAAKKYMVRYYKNKTLTEKLAACDQFIAGAERVKGDELSSVSEFLKDPAKARLFYANALSIDAQEEICRVMKEQGITKQELALRRGVSPAAITKFMREDNIGLKTLADTAFVLGYVVKIMLVPVEQV